MAQRRQKFQTTLNAEILLENCDGTEIQAARFNPRNTGDGTIIWYGAGVYDWYAPGGSNQNVKKLTENSLLYLAGGESMLSSTDLQGKQKVGIYPNPVSAILNIQADENVSSEIYDMNGRKIISSESKTIPVDKLVHGNYSVKVKTEASYKTFKFIKK